MMGESSKVFVLSILFLLLLLSKGVVPANVIYFWVGSSSSDYNNPTNWLCSTIDCNGAPLPPSSADPTDSLQWQGCSANFNLTIPSEIVDSPSLYSSPTSSGHCPQVTLSTGAKWRTQGALFPSIGIPDFRIDIIGSAILRFPNGVFNPAILDLSQATSFTLTTGKADLAEVYFPSNPGHLYFDYQYTSLFPIPQYTIHNFESSELTDQRNIYLLSSNINTTTCIFEIGSSLTKNGPGKLVFATSPSRQGFEWRSLAGSNLAINDGIMEIRSTNTLSSIDGATLSIASSAGLNLQGPIRISNQGVTGGGNITCDNSSVTIMNTAHLSQIDLQLTGTQLLVDGSFGPGINVAGEGFDFASTFASRSTLTVNDFSNTGSQARIQNPLLVITGTFSGIYRIDGVSEVTLEGDASSATVTVTTLAKFILDTTVGELSSVFAPSSNGYLDIISGMQTLSWTESDFTQIHVKNGGTELSFLDVFTNAKVLKISGGSVVNALVDDFMNSGVLCIEDGSTFNGLSIMNGGEIKSAGGGSDNKIVGPVVSDGNITLSSYLTVEGNLSLTSSGFLVVDFNANDVQGILNVMGTAVLDGTIFLNFINPVQPSGSHTIVIGSPLLNSLGVADVVHNHPLGGSLEPRVTKNGNELNINFDPVTSPPFNPPTVPPDSGGMGPSQVPTIAPTEPPQGPTNAPTSPPTTPEPTEPPVAPTKPPVGDCHPIIECMQRWKHGKFRIYFGWRCEDDKDLAIDSSSNQLVAKHSDIDDIFGRPHFFHRGRSPFFPRASFSVIWNPRGNSKATCKWRLWKRVAIATLLTKICPIRIKFRIRCKATWVTSGRVNNLHNWLSSKMKVDHRKIKISVRGTIRSWVPRHKTKREITDWDDKRALEQQDDLVPQIENDFEIELVDAFNATENSTVIDGNTFADNMTAFDCSDPNVLAEAAAMSGFEITGCDFEATGKEDDSAEIGVIVAAALLSTAAIVGIVIAVVLLATAGGGTATYVVLKSEPRPATVENFDDLSEGGTVVHNFSGSLHINTKASSSPNMG